MISKIPEIYILLFLCLQKHSDNTNLTQFYYYLTLNMGLYEITIACESRCR